LLICESVDTFFIDKLFPFLSNYCTHVAADVHAIVIASAVASDLVDVIGPAVAGVSAISGVPFTVGVLPLLLLSVLASLLFLASLHAVASVSAVAIGTDVSDVDGVSPMLMPLLSPTFSHTAGILLF
jgi:hypothetical protein